MNVSSHRFPSALIASLPALLSTACGAPTEREPAETGVERQAAATAPVITWFRWNKGEPAKRMERVSTHVCGLGMVRGELAKDTQVFIREGTGFHELFGVRPGSNSLQLDGVCVPLSAFRLNAGQAPTNGQHFSATITNQFNTTASRSMTPGSAAILTQVMGAFNGAPEQAWVTWGGTPTVNVRNGTAPGTHNAMARSLVFGVAPRFNHRDDTEWQLGSAAGDGMLGSWDIECPYGFLCNNVGNLSETFCYLSSVSGDFNGAREWAQVFPRAETGRWHFNIDRGGGSSVYASVNCLLYDQTRPPLPAIR